MEKGHLQRLPLKIHHKVHEGYKVTAFHFVSFANFVVNYREPHLPAKDEKYALQTLLLPAEQINYDAKV